MPICGFIDDLLFKSTYDFNGLEGRQRISYLIALGIYTHSRYASSLLRCTVGGLVAGIHLGWQFLGVSCLIAFRGVILSLTDVLSWLVIVFWEIERIRIWGILGRVCLGEMTGSSKAVVWWVLCRSVTNFVSTTFLCVIICWEVLWLCSIAG